MTNLEKAIFQFAENKCHSNSLKETASLFFSTEEIMNKMNLGRTQVSRTLNQLVSDNILFKINTRPVLFSLKEFFAKKYQLEIASEYESIEIFKTKLNSISSEKVFEKVIGYNSGLAEAVEQLKTAIFYPNNGLPVLLMGETGVGKSYFAQIMDEYMVREGVLLENSPFFTLNCAQYANNPELLSGILFGYTKGAFTGADEDHKGLLEAADKGVLFLDEVHRLNDEGQEKLFNFMDKKNFSRIGETKERQSKVRLVFATTESTESFLPTFLRRIPIQIYIPSVAERSLFEKRQLIEYLFKKESQDIKRTIEVTPRVMDILLQTTFSGNIGEMENVIKYACGSAIAHSNESRQVEIKIKDLPQKIYASFDSPVDLASTEEENLVFSDQINFSVTPSTTGELQKFVQHLVWLYQDYQKETGYTVKHQLHQQTVKFMDDVIFREKQRNQAALEKFISTVMQEIFREIDSHTKFQYDGNLVLLLSYYIYHYSLKGINLTDLFDSEFTAFVQNNYQTELNQIIPLLPEIEKRLDVSFTKADQLLFALFFSTLNYEVKSNEINAIMIAHGYATASSIANVCNRMLGGAVFTSIDMPVESTIFDISEKVLRYLEEYSVKQGLLVLVDMGSLNMIYEQLKQNINQPILFIDQLSTPLALEVGNLIQQDHSLNEIAESMKEVVVPNIQLYYPKKSKKKAIVTTCFSGLGVAIQIQKLLYDCLGGILEVDILPIEFAELQTNGLSEAFLSQYDVLSVIGTNDVHIPEMKFVYLENIISGNGDTQLKEIFENLLSETEIREVNDRLVKNFSLIRVLESLTILDTKRIMEVIENCIQDLERRLTLRLSNARKVAIYVHVACMVERLIRHAEITDFPNLEQFAFEHEKEIRVIQDIFSVLEPVYSVTIPLEETCYIYNILYLD
ncbi:transcriptional antiterminator [Tetragenococcus halophilus subsp. flandriensis]|uniref:sigma 54-interacting transcriptional regulator n=1 Tax=Tetragenococcus halophilus TaxID=51669 RepID=UPI0023E9EC5B|nr:sigma 54-interacting transcriptional regulator [Tetragenococcus halophilus]GMA08181.1 transcriptional antiterminator [Tetragenococcus halophilus subsp. flandriensis]